LNCPTCRFQFIQIHTDQDDASSDGGEYLPSSEGEEDIEVDTNASEFVNFPGDDIFVPDWDDIESSLIVHSAFEDQEGEEEEEIWMDNHDPEYDDLSVEGGNSDLEYMGEEYEDAELDPVIEEGEDAEDSFFDSCLGEDPDIDPFRFGFHQVIEPEPEFDPAYQDDSWDPPEFTTAEEYRSYEPSDEMGYEAQDAYFDDELAVEETFEDEPLGYEPDFDLANEAEYDLNCIDDVLGESGDNHPAGELISDSEQEKSEVELGLTNGESNAYSARTKFKDPVCFSLSLPRQLKLSLCNLLSESQPRMLIPPERLFITPTTCHS